MRICYLLLTLHILSFPSYAEEALKYISITQGNKISTEWIIEETNTTLTIESSSSDKSSSKLILNTDYSLKSFEQSEPKKNLIFQAKRDNGTLSASSQKNDKIKTKSYDIGKKPWVQDFTFGFKEFLSSNDREYKFQILNPQDLDMHDLIATKEYIEELKIDSTSYVAQKMKVTLQGFKRRFWRAELWYDTKTRTLLRYKANEGPGTPITETLFLGSS